MVSKLLRTLPWKSSWRRCFLDYAPVVRTFGFIDWTLERPWNESIGAYPSVKPRIRSFTHFPLETKHAHWRNNDEQQLPRTSGCSTFLFVSINYYCKQARKLSDRRHKYLFLSSLCKIRYVPIQFSKMLSKHQKIRFNQPAQKMELFINLPAVPFKVDIWSLIPYFQLKKPIYLFWTICPRSIPWIEN